MQHSITLAMAARSYGRPEPVCTW